MKTTGPINYWPISLLLWTCAILLASSSHLRDSRNFGRFHKRIWNAYGERFLLHNEYRFLRPHNASSHHVTAQLGATAFLHCRVRNADRGITGAEQVSWIRRRDWHILSSGMFMYTNDERFQVLHPEGSDDWTLQIKYVQKRDNGTYECQVSTGTGVISHMVHMHIVIPEAHIVGGNSEHHVDVGSVISLVCVIERSPTPPQYVFWYHNDRMINYDTERHVHVRTEPTVAHTRSKLTVRTARETDSGNYTCSAANAEPASIHVFVSEADKMAAILRRKTSVGNIITSEMTFFIIGFSIIFLTMR